MAGSPGSSRQAVLQSALIQTTQAVLLLLVLAVSSCHYQPPSTDRSGRSLRSAIDSVPPEWRDEPAIILSDSVKIEFLRSKSGNSVRRSECTWIYINKRNPEVLNAITVNDFETIETVPQITLNVLYPDGRSSLYTSLNFTRFRGSEETEFTTNKMVNYFSVPRYQAGMLLRLEVVRKYTRPSFVSAEYLRDEYNCLEKHVSIAWPRGCAINHRLQNAENLPLDEMSDSSGPQASWAVSGKKLVKMQAEYRLRYPEQWYAALHFGLPPDSGRSLSWKDLGDHYLDMLEPSFATSADIKKMAGTITAADPAAIVEKAFQLVLRHIRYHAREEKIYAIVPRPAAEVLSLGYGDCKEMSALLAMILAEKGITAHPALASFPGLFQAVDSVPALGGFNHMLLYLPRFDRNPLFLDPTVQFGHARNSYYHLINQKAYILEKGKSRLVDIVPRPGEGVTRVWTGSRIERSREGDRWEMSGSIRLSDNAAYLFYPFIKELKGEENNPGLVAVLRSSFNLEARSVRLETSGPDSIVVTYTANSNKNYVDIDKGGFVLETPSLFGGPARFTTIRKEGPRIFEEIQQQDEWTVPKEFTEIESSDLSHAVAAGRWTRKGPTVSRTFAMKWTVLPASRDDELAGFLKSKDKFFKATIWRK